MAQVFDAVGHARPLGLPACARNMTSALLFSAGLNSSQELLIYPQLQSPESLVRIGLDRAAAGSLGVAVLLTSRYAQAPKGRKICVLAAHILSFTPAGTLFCLQYS